MTTLNADELRLGHELISPNGKRWVVETIHGDPEHQITLRSEGGRARTILPRELTRWRRRRLVAHTEYAPSGIGSVITVTGTEDIDSARAFAHIELRIIYSERGETPVTATGHDMVVFAPTEEDARAAVTSPATTDRDDW